MVGELFARAFSAIAGSDSMTGPASARSFGRPAADFSVAIGAFVTGSVELAGRPPCVRPRRTRCDQARKELLADLR